MKNLFKRISALCLTLCMILFAGILAACGDEQAESGTVTYSVTVQLADGSAAAGVKVTLAKGSTKYGPFTTDANGKISTVLEADSYEVTLSSLPDGTSWGGTLTLTAAAPSSTVKLTAGQSSASGTTYSVTVLYPDGTPVQNVFVGWCIVLESGETGACSMPVATNAEGVATMSLTPATYHVQIVSGIPNGYTYAKDEHNYFTGTGTTAVDVPKESPAITITLSAASAVEMTMTGNYAVVFQSADVEYVEVILNPSKSGAYAISSETNVCDPKIGYYPFRYNSATWDSLDEGMKNDNVSETDKNFHYEVSITDSEMFIDGRRNEQVWVFRVYLNKNAAMSYPVSVNLKLERIGDASEIHIEVTEVAVRETLAKYPEKNEGEAFVAAKTNGSMTVVYNSTDRFYHVGTANGPVLVAKITQSIEPYYDRAIIELDEFASNPYVFVTGTVARDYSVFLRGTKEFGGTPEPNKEYYAKYVNSDGVYGVTEELKTFLVAFAADNTSWLKFVDSTLTEENMWLFACGYYSAQ